MLIKVCLSTYVGCVNVGPVLLTKFLSGLFLKTAALPVFSLYKHINNLIINIIYFKNILILIIRLLAVLLSVLMVHETVLAVN